MAEVMSIDENDNAIQTSVGTIHYDYLVLGMGATTNFFGNEQIARNAFPMKTVSDAIDLRNHILHNLELADNADSFSPNLLINLHRYPVVLVDIRLCS